ncbi:RNA polymerase sigma factor [Amycolatopsis sp. lyj-90]|uniref:RNA polymerase sigma factor n=1 Tax=Amycolatopsis sp. lyj-90 TaxID=2789285 RepID=UPI0039791EEC
MTDEQEPDPGDNGDLDLVDCLYRAYAKPLRRYVRHVAANRGLSESLVDTEGVVHEAFVAMLCTRTTIEDPPAWLFTVARRLISKIAAQPTSRAVGEPQDLLHTNATQWTSLTAQASTEDVAEAREVLARIAELPDRQKIAVYLRNVQGWSTAELSDYLKCAPATANVHSHRGRQRIRLAMAVAVFLLSANLVAWMPPWWVPPPPPLDPSFVDLVPLIILALLVVIAVLVCIVCCVKAFRYRWAVHQYHRAELRRGPGEQAGAEDG